MRILLIADEESPYLWEHYQPGRLDGIDLILSCGDLAPEYLSFLVTMGRAPVLYVHGNHDGKYSKRPPEGCQCIEDTIVNFNGVRILGLGGCQRYGPGPHQYSEKEMARRIRKMRFKLFLNRGTDIVISHAPLRGMGDEDHITHRGFVCFHKLLNKYKPRYWVYGHVHLSYGVRHQRIIQHNETTLINASERYIIDVEPLHKPNPFAKLFPFSNSTD